MIWVNENWPVDGLPELTTTDDLSTPELTDTTPNETTPKSHGLFSAIGGFFKLAIIVLILGLIVTGGFLIGGFLKFTDTVTSYATMKSPEKAAAIAVYTGGPSRIDEAVKLLKDGKGQRLLISGVHPDTSITTLGKNFHIDQHLFDCCIDIDRRASNTKGNAVETGKWRSANKFDSLILVTSNYHMPRSLLETRRQLPGIKIAPYPVIAADFNSSEWFKDRDSLKLLLKEYSKYVATQIGPFIPDDTIRTIRSSMASF